MRNMIHGFRPIMTKQINVAVPLSDEEWECYNSLDIETTVKFDECVEKIGAESIECNGHFGQFYYFTCDNRKQAAKILRVMRNQFKKLMKKGIKNDI